MTKNLETACIGNAIIFSMDKKKKRKLFFLGFIAINLIVALLFEIPVAETVDVPNRMPGRSVKCVLITDLHSCYYGDKQSTLVDMVKEQDPDLIFLCGDIFDDKKDNVNTKIFLNQAVQICPCYYVSGNHEYWSNEYDSFFAYLNLIGVHSLRGTTETILLNGKRISISGVDDPDFVPFDSWNEQLLEASYGVPDDAYSILLTHRPELAEVYTAYDFDLILAGHAHCGQVRIPFLNVGLYTPNQGFFAKYVNGLYELKEGQYMIVSRGLARESTPLPRYFNNPEIVVFEI